MVGNVFKGKNVYVDANTLIYAIEAPRLFPVLKANLVDPFSNGLLAVTTSWITLAEVLVKPLQTGDTQLENYYRQLFSPSATFSVIQVDEAIASSAAAIRAAIGLRLPDAIHIATGQLMGCDCFLTRDAQWAKAGINVIDPTS